MKDFALQHRWLLPVACLLSMALASLAVAADAPSFTAAALAEHVRILSSDEFEGRRPTTPGEEKTVAYIEQAFRAAGLKPGVGDSFRQAVPFVELTAQPSESLLVTGGRAELALRYGPQAVYWTTRVTSEVTLADSDLVFVGYGIVDPARGWNDYAGLDMRGKTAVILVNDPGFATADPEFFKGRTMTYFGRWTYKFEEASRQGAAAAIIVHEEEPAAYPWAVVQNGAARPQVVIDTPDGHAGNVGIEGWMTRDAALQVFAAAGLDYGTLKDQASRPGFKPVPMGLKASARVSNAIRKANSSNVIGRLEGRTRPHEYVVVTAHWDHLGRADVGGDDDIFNGAVDNATGVGGVIELGRAFAGAAQAPERSILFIAFTGEEDGLLGSRYFAEHPTVPLEQVAGGLNIDVLPVYGRTRDVVAIGYGSSELEDYLRDAAGLRGLVLAPDPTPEKGSYFRSDHFNLAKEGVPMLYAKGGVDSIEHGREWGLAWQRDFISQRYHKPSDEFDPDWDLSGALEYLQLCHAVMARLANESRFPQWYVGNEFRPIREQSRGAASSRQ